MRFLFRYGLSAFAFLVATSVFAQQGYQFISRDHNRDLEKYINSPESNIHGQVQPFLNTDIAAEVHPDSLRPDSMAFAWSQRMFLKNRNPQKTNLRFFPMLNLLGGVDVNDRQTRGTYETGVGVGVGADVGRKFSFYADVRGFYGRYPGYVENYMLLREVNPGLGYARFDGRGFSSWDFSGYVSYSPLEPFNIQAGVGKNFWGEGIRSLWLSDQSTSYPFLKITTTIWNIKYVNLFNVMYDIRGSGGDYSEFALKYSSMHLLSWNISKRVNVSLWESVIWQNRDNDNLRGFDVNYLNPIIFYRPVEFSQGSSDRVTIGLNFSVKVGSNTKLFTQIAVDEFLLDSLRSGNGWFGNKQALQVGGKSFDAFGVEGLDIRGEFNLIRPFFYQHVSVKQNHAHYNEPLAHGLGNNLYEAILSGRFRRNRWVFDARVLVARYGQDTDSLNLGGDIFRSDVDPPRPESGHHIAQGVQHLLVSTELRAGFIIDQHLGLRLEAAYIPRYLIVEGATQYNHFIQVGLRTALWNRNRLF